MTSFVNTLSKVEKPIVDKLRRAVLDIDKSVMEKTGAIMSAKDALCYLEDGVMKYGLAQNKKGVTFHSMVMYANPDVVDLTKKTLPGVKLQKGCFNISSLAEFDLDGFEKVLRLSAQKDFTPVIEHYKKNMEGKTS
ncbi:MAG: hypothetical protein DHS20C05_14220 [Hyphococcus sp.]|nr:MAG: hypothetical protein DHS20C05_14220 [Marinicaulis sp.]